MKSKPTTFMSQMLIILLAALVLSLTIQFAQAQRSPSQRRGQVVQIDMPQKSLAKKILENTTLTYYQQLLGPTVGGDSSKTYNVFQESRTSYQSFHAMNLRYNINPDWSVGTSLAVATAYGDDAENMTTGHKGTMERDEFFNSRFYVTLPTLPTLLGTLFTTVSYEAPTSVISRNDDMRYGFVFAQSFGLNLPNPNFTTGIMWQYYRMYFQENVVPARNGLMAFARQTTILSGGPYGSYRFNDRWMMTSSITFDWDQRGDQTSTSSYNNNLPDRARAGVSYFPTIKYLTSVGVFTQALLKYTADTHAVGAEVAVKF